MGREYFVEVKLAEATRAMRRVVYDRNLATEFGRLKLEEITPSRLLARCEKIRELGAPALAVQAQDIVLQIYRFIQARGLKIENPAEAIRPSAIATFKVRDRALSPEDIHRFFNALEEVSSAATLRLAVKFMLLTMVRKSEFPQTKWDEINFETAVWTIPKERMKAGRPHNVYLSQQALDILVAFKTCYGASPYEPPVRCCMKLDTTLTGSRNVWLTSNEECVPFTTRLSTPSSEEQCSKLGLIWWTHGF